MLAKTDKTREKEAKEYLEQSSIHQKKIPFWWDKIDGLILP
jgi:hypothetical protein